METLQERHGIVSAGDVRRILNTDNSEIKDLCKQLKVYPKRDKRTGKTFFMREDVEFLKRMKELHANTSKYNEIDAQPVKYAPVSVHDNTTMLVVNEFKGLIEKMMSNQDKLIEKMQSTLDNKLEGLDEIVVELIQVKTENENLRIKLNQMTKENYELKNSLEQFRPVGFGFYVK
ncbi:MAG: hypothetical protein MJ180_04370 [Candidatus Gastranaerophilales bacterium]|nr:hypothetical protein [Candidatus Gastranaerophilales bacterium]